jgi:hypothetical protein
MTFALKGAIAERKCAHKENKLSRRKFLKQIRISEEYEK